MKFRSVYPLLYNGKIQTFLHRFGANLARCLQACRVVFCLLWYCAGHAQTCRANNAHNFNEISKFLPSFVLRQNSTFLHRFAANLAWCLQACSVVFFLLWCCAPFAQTCRANNAHNFIEINHSVYPLLYYGKTQTFLHRFGANLARCLQACRVVFFLLWCCAPFAQTYRANNAHNFNKISKYLPSFVLRQNSTFLHRFAAYLARCLQACRVVFCLLWCCAGHSQTCRANNAHNFNEISKYLPSFVQRQNSTFLHRFAANLARCLQACSVVFFLLWCCAPFAQTCRANNAHNFNEISKCLPSFVLRQNSNFSAQVWGKFSKVFTSL